MKITHCGAHDPAWNAFVQEDAGASVFHLLEWQRVIAQAYGHEAHYLVAEEAGRVAGVLPLFLIRSRLFGRSLVSLPFSDYGGICAAGAPSVVSGLLQEALRIGRACRADYLQLRHREPCAGVTGVASDKITMLLSLAADPGIIWARLPSERRNRIKKAQRMGLTGRFLGAEGLDRFYEVFSENMRDLGSPVHGREFFRAIVGELGPRARILLVERADETIGAAMCLFFRDTVHIPWVSSLRRYFALNPNMVLYWTAVEHACNNGYRTLDFGRSSPGTGTYEFKRQWGARPVELAWSSFALQHGRVPTFSGEGLKERILVECWKRLPMAITRQLGPRVRGLIPA